MAAGKPGASSIDRVTARIPKLDRLCPQHIVSRATGEETDAALIDQWGRVHRLSSPTALGRELEEVDLAVLDRSVSRIHAEVRRAGGVWSVIDWGSTNGTFVESEQITEATELSDGDRLSVGEVGFAFYERGAVLFEGMAPPALARTVRSDNDADEPRLLLLGRVHGGGGIVEFGGEYVQLGPSRYALLHLLASRWAEQASMDDAVRGYVRSVDILEELPWDTAYPDDNNVKQVVRRVRRALDKAGASDAIEARHGFGYRLRLPSQIQET